MLGFGVFLKHACGEGVTTSLTEEKQKCVCAGDCSRWTETQKLVKLTMEKLMFQRS